MCFGVVFVFVVLLFCFCYVSKVGAENRTIPIRWKSSIPPLRRMRLRRSLKSNWSLRRSQSSTVATLVVARRVQKADGRARTHRTMPERLSRYQGWRASTQISHRTGYGAKHQDVDGQVHVKAKANTTAPLAPDAEASIEIQDPQPPQRTMHPNHRSNDRDSRSTTEGRDRDARSAATTAPCTLATDVAIEIQDHRHVAIEIQDLRPWRR